MQKAQARSFQRRYKVHEIDVSPSLRAVEDDFIPTAANMGMADVEQERAQLLIELTKFEQRMSIAKRDGDLTEVAFIGNQKAAICTRLATLRLRRAQLSRDEHAQATYQAIRDVCSDEIRERIYARAEEIRTAQPHPTEGRA